MPAPRRSEIATTARAVERMRKLGDIVVTRDDRGGLAEALSERLRAAGLRARAGDRASITVKTDGVISLEGLRSAADRDAAIGLHREAFLVAKTVAPRLNGAEGGLFITVQDTGGAFGLDGGLAGAHAWASGFAGLAKTARLEWPNAHARAIDLERGERNVQVLADALAREILEGGCETEIGLRKDGQRTTLALVSEQVASSGGEKGAVGPESVLLVTGGARGVTAHCLIALARRTKPRAVILCGRTKLESEPVSCRGLNGAAELRQALLADARAAGRTVTPRDLAREVEGVSRAREAQANIAALRGAGVEVEYVSVDAGDPAALRAALQPLRSKWGAITGVIHGAGVLADKLIADKTEEQFDSVFRVKAGGLAALLDVTCDDPLTLLALFSSVAARSGNVGQCDYAMSNEILNKVADAEAARRGEGCVVKSINWGPWEGGMVTPELARHFRQLGVEMVPLDDGAEAFVQEVTRPGRDVEIVIGSARIHDV